MRKNIWFTFDFETSDQNKYTCTIDRVCVAQFNIETGKIEKEWDFSYREGGVSRTTVLTYIMSLPNTKVAHNADFDLYIMEYRLKIPVKGEVHDTYMMAKHYHNALTAYDLKTLAWLILGDVYLPLLKLREWFHKQRMKGEDDLDFNMTLPPDKLVHDYCTHDNRMTAGLAHWFYPKIVDNYAYSMDTQFIRFNMEMEAVGITVDEPYFKDLIRRGARRIKRNTKQASKEMQLDGKRKPTGNALRERLANHGEVRKTKTGMIKADDTVLRDYKDDAAIRAVSRIRTDTKLLNTYAVNILDVSKDYGFFHPSLRQSAAITRRYRSWDFYGDNGLVRKGNIQNFPRGEGIRTGIIVPPGYGFVKLDLASIEARMFSSFIELLMGESTFADMYRKDPFFSPYLYVIEACTNEGKVSKSHPLYMPYKHGTLGRLYGSSPRRFSIQLRDDFELDYSEDECSEIYKNIDKSCPFIREFQNFMTALIRQKGCVFDPFGAVYYVPSSEAYKAVAYLCQGAAGNVLKWWGLAFQPLMEKTEDYVFSCCHDEFDCAIKKDRGFKKRIKQYTSGVLDKLDIFDIPIISDATWGANWSDCGN